MILFINISNYKFVKNTHSNEILSKKNCALKDASMKVDRHKMHFYEKMILINIKA